MRYNDNWANGGYFTCDAGYERACKGDSGGPIMGVAPGAGGASRELPTRIELTPPLELSSLSDAAERS